VKHFSIYDVLAEILIRHFPNANRKLCHVNQLSRIVNVMKVQIK